MSKASPTKPPIEITCSRHFLAWLYEEQISLAFTTYQTKRLFLVGLKTDGKLSIFERLFDHAMGLHATPEALYLGTRYQIWQFANILNQEEQYKGYDRLYIPRIAHTTGNIDIHDMAIDQNGKLFFVNTLYSCVGSVSHQHSFIPEWRPPFISTLAPEDRCHLNGLAIAGGKPRYVTAVSRSDVVEGWRDHRTEGGCVIDMESNDIILNGLSMPHSPRFYDNRLWLLNSGTGDFGYVDLHAGSFEPITFCRGYLRGLAFHKNYAVVGLSKPRHNKTFNGLPLQNRLSEKNVSPCCGLMIIDIHTGHVVHWLLIQGVTTELYDVQILHGVKCPMALGLKTDEIQRIISLPPEYRKDQSEGFTMMVSGNKESAG